jgi:hypothetical protein
MRVYRIIVDQQGSAGWTWLIKVAHGARGSRPIKSSMGGDGAYCVFASARTAFEDGLDVLCALTTDDSHPVPVRPPGGQHWGDAGAVHDAYWEAQS